LCHIEEIKMPDITLQFHATVPELRQLVTQISELEPVHLAVIRVRPFHARRISRAELEEFFGKISAYPRWAFSLSPFITATANEIEFADRNPDHLRLDWGEPTQEGLPQSWLSARTANRNAIAVWKRIAGRIRRATKAGVTAISPEGGASVLMRSFRYSPGAEALEKEGIQMLPFAGTSRLRIRGKAT
jgi:hypothetical protein